MLLVVRVHERTQRVERALCSLFRALVLPRVKLRGDDAPVVRDGDLHHSGLCVWCVRVLCVLLVVFVDETFDTGEVRCTLRPCGAILLVILHVLY